MEFKMSTIEENLKEESDLAKEREIDKKKNIGPRSEITSEPKDKWEEVSLDDEEKK